MSDKKQKQKKPVDPTRRGRRPMPRGWPGPGGGYSTYLQAPQEWRGTTVQVCGMWPFGAGTGSPMVGVPIGRNILSGATMCCDPISWFMRAKLISNPSMFVLGKPGLGKSTITRRMALGLAGYGVQPLVLGDLKPDYKDLIEALGGQVIQLGRGRGHLNVLDPGESREAALRLTGKAREAIQADAHGRRQTMVSALIAIMRNQNPNDREETILDEALKVLDERFQGTPVLRDLLQVIQDAPDRVRNVALDRGSLDRYRQITEGLEASLIGLVGGGRLGEIFSEQTDNPMQMDRPVVFDVSNVDDSETSLQAAVLLACWSYGFGAVAVSQALADAGLEPRRHYFVILDELWRVLRAGSGLVDRVDALTRLNRQRGVGMAMISHTMSDLLALPNPEDRMKAKGFVERSGMVICGGLPRAEMDNLTEVVSMSMEEQNMLVGWQDPPAWDPATGKEAAPPGRGNFLIKVGGRPGIPVHVGLTSVEREINDTNKLWTTGENGQPQVVEVAPDGSEAVVGEYNLDDPAMLPPPDPNTRVSARTGVDE
ncbi:ATP/GTP-binding protein [Kribbella sp. WER1]